MSLDALACTAGIAVRGRLNQSSYFFFKSDLIAGPFLGPTRECRSIRVFMDPLTEVQLTALQGLNSPQNVDWQGEALASSSLAERLQPRHAFNECMDEAAMQKFLNCRSCLPKSFLPFLTLSSVDQYKSNGTRLFLSDCGRGGYGLCGKELVSVFSLPGAKLGLEIAHDAISRGARRLDTLDVNGKVVGLYLRAGFKEISRLAWDPYCAPPEWDHQIWGCPDLVIMTYGEVTE